MGHVTDYRELAQKLKPYIAPWIVAQGNSQAASSAVSGMSAHALSGAYHTGTLAQSQAPWAVTDDEFAVHTGNPDAHHATATAGSGISITGQQVSLSTPGTLTVSSSNNAASHTHAITSSSNPGATAAILASNSGGGLNLVTLTTSGLISSTGAAGGIVVYDRLDTADSARRWTAYATNNAYVLQRGSTDEVWFGTGGGIFTPGNLGLQPAGDLFLDPSGGEVFVPGSRTLRSSSWTSGVLGTGWGIQERGGAGKSHLDIRSIYTDELIATTFTADQVRVRSGSDWLGEALAIASRDNSDAKVTIPNVGGGSVRIYVEDAPEITGQIFDANEYVLVKTINRSSGLVIRETWGQVSSYLDEVNGRQSYSWTTVSGTGGFTLEPGTALIGFGASGGSYIYRSVIESGKGPFERFATWSTNPYTPANRVSRVEIGDIKNAAGDSTTRYGIAAGNNLALTPTTGFSGVTVDSVNGARLYNGLLEMYSGGSKFLGVDATNGIEIASSAVGQNDQRALTFLDGANTIAGLWAFHVAGGDIDLQMGVNASGKARDGTTTINTVGDSGYDRRTVLAADGPYVEVRRAPDSSQTIALVAASGVSINSGTAWHSLNDGSGSGLDADTVDGSHASAFATSGHNHDATYGRLAAENTWSVRQIVSVADAVYALALRGSTARLRVMPYENATYGTVIQAVNAAESALTTLTIGGSPTILQGATIINGTSTLYSAYLSVYGNIHSNGAVTGEGFLQMYYRASSPGTGGTGWGRLWLKDIGGGKVQLRLQTNTSDYLVVGDP